MKFIQFLKQNQNTRKIFGERELKIIEKQLQGINLTQSEKNRLSRDIRTKFDFIKEVQVYAAEFELKKGADVKEQIAEVMQIIQEDKLMPKIRKIILFGSTAEGIRSFRSDIDIAVLFSEITRQEAFDFRRRILGEVEKVDIQVYNILADKIKKEIDLRGKVLYR